MRNPRGKGRAGIERGIVGRGVHNLAAAGSMDDNPRAVCRADSSKVAPATGKESCQALARRSAGRQGTWPRNILERAHNMPRVPQKKKREDPRQPRGASPTRPKTAWRRTQPYAARSTAGFDPLVKGSAPRGGWSPGQRAWRPRSVQGARRHDNAADGLAMAK